MTFWRAANFDHRRMRRELSALGKESPAALETWCRLCRKGDEDELEMGRLMLADMAEESGRHVLARMIREWMTCRKPGKKKARGRR